jgi:hypothetical protein
MLRSGWEIIKTKAFMPNQDWATWSFLETYVRLASWSSTLSAITLAYDPQSVAIFPHQVSDLPVPHDEEFWQARSAQEWELRGGSSSHHHTPKFAVLATAVIRGEYITENVSSFGLLCLIGWILAYICNHERLSLGLFDAFEDSFIQKLERGLCIWEGLFRRHPLADQVGYKHADPLLADCFSLVGSAYYHLYIGEDLRIFKEVAARQETGGAANTVEFFPRFRSQEMARKAVRYAVNSWLVRVKLGISRLNRTAALIFGGHYMMTSYECGKFVSQDPCPDYMSKG